MFETRTTAPGPGLQLATSIPRVGFEGNELSTPPRTVRLRQHALDGPLDMTVKTTNAIGGTPVHGSREGPGKVGHHTLTEHPRYNKA